jgi:murein DD-endopeptidase MepM/ murein hydrolase activator NlpD
MRRRLVPLAAALVLFPVSTAAADTGGATAPTGTGGSAYGSARPGPALVARRFRVTPRTIVPGAALTVAWRVNGRVRRALLRVVLRPARGGRPAAKLRLGLRRTNRAGRVRWKPTLAPGAYTASLRASARRADGRAHASSSSSVTVAAPPVAATSGVFPVRGPYSFGGPDARFGAPRVGHTHQGQDILAAEGTPVVAPRPGVVYWRAYQAGGAGYYVVVRGDDRRDYVFMHFEEGSTAVVKGQAVTAGQLLGKVGATGDASGPHLHFEIWRGAWQADGEAIDPKPLLRRWLAGG